MCQKESDYMRGYREGMAAACRKSNEERFADIIAKAWNYKPLASDVRRLLTDHWTEISRLAHLIHDGRP